MQKQIQLSDIENKILRAEQSRSLLEGRDGEKNKNGICCGACGDAGHFTNSPNCLVGWIGECLDARDPCGILHPNHKNSVYKVHSVEVYNTWISNKNGLRI